MEWKNLFICIGLLAFVPIIAVALFPGLIMSEDSAIDALDKNGFTNIKIIDKQWIAVDIRGCSSDDHVKFVATATNPIGKEVKVFVCKGILKGATVRTD